MMQREAHGVETTQIDRWGREEPWGEAQQTVTHGGEWGDDREMEWAPAALGLEASLCWG